MHRMECKECFHANFPPLDLLFIIFDQRRILYTNRVGEEAEAAAFNESGRRVLRHHILCPVTAAYVYLASSGVLHMFNETV